jgi:signal transduction histidine kinase/CheY-like chemotaxis protein
VKKAGGARKRPSDLRRRAEERLAKRVAGPLPTDHTEIRRLLHELEVHQVQLEMQNEELFRSRVEAEGALERYTELFDFAPIGYAMLDPDGTIREINHAGAKVLGEHRALLVNHPFESRIEPRDRAAFASMIVEASVSERAVTGEISTVVVGPLRNIVAMRAFALRHGQLKILLSFEDVTETRAKALKLEESEQALREADRRKDEFLAVLSHELRNPLTPLRNGLFVLASEPSREQSARAFAIMDRQLDHLTRLIDDMLDVTRITRGKIELRRAKLDLREVVLRALEDHRAGLDEAGIALDQELQAGEFPLDADEARVVQVVTNLLHNAQKFTKRGGRLTVTLRARSPGVELALRDTGVGIAPDVLPHVFEPFVQAPQTTARSYGGLGLGLAMVKGLVELHGGTARIESRGVGRGMQVTLWFPLAKGARRKLPRRTPAPAASQRVLIIEDNADTSDSLRLALALAGHEVKVAHDGTTGIALARSFHPDIVLCDIGLPGMDGYEVARTLRADADLRDTYIAAVTGYARPEDVSQAEEAGFDQHVAKPLSGEKLERILGKRGADA